jgi:hypothetical protein
MMRSVIRSFAALAVVLAAISANAQHSIRVSVPFAFAAAEQILPAGDYRLSHNESGDLVTLSGQELKTTLLLTAAGDRFQDGRSVLRFERHGNEWSLQEIASRNRVRRNDSAASIGNEKETDRGPRLFGSEGHRGRSYAAIRPTLIFTTKGELT